MPKLAKLYHWLQASIVMLDGSRQYWDALVSWCLFRLLTDSMEKEGRVKGEKEGAWPVTLLVPTA